MHLDHALGDLREGIARTPIWLTLGWDDLRLRYQRTTLGPLWYTMGTAVLVVFLGYLWSLLLGRDIAAYMPYLAAGICVWQFIAAAMTEGTGVLSRNGGIIRNMDMPVTLHVHRLVFRLLMTFVHTLPVFLILIPVFGLPVGWPMLAAVPGIALLIVNATWVAVVFGMLGARFRDFPPIIATIMPPLFFMTPVMWMPDMLGGGRRALLAELNPLAHMLAIVRDPLLNTVPPLASYAVVGVITLAGIGLMLVMLGVYRRRIPFWM